jgi:hypothetical protein
MGIHSVVQDDKAILPLDLASWKSRKCLTKWQRKCASNDTHSCLPLLQKIKPSHSQYAVFCNVLLRCFLRTLLSKTLQRKDSDNQLDLAESGVIP